MFPAMPIHATGRTLTSPNTMPSRIFRTSFFSLILSPILRKMDAGHKQVRTFYWHIHFGFWDDRRRRIVTQTILQRKIASMDGVLKWDNLAIYYGSKIEETKVNLSNIYVEQPESSISFVVHSKQIHVLKCCSARDIKTKNY